MNRNQCLSVVFLPVVLVIGVFGYLPGCSARTSGKAGELSTRVPGDVPPAVTPELVARLNTLIEKGDAAAMNGRLEIAKLLVEKGADVNAKKKDGWTPLRFARTRKHPEIEALLTEHGASGTRNDER